MTYLTNRYELYHDLSLLKYILLKFVNCRNCTTYKNSKPKLIMCTQSHALGTHTKFQLEILTINVISGIVYFCEIFLESLWKISETNPRRVKYIFWFANIHVYNARNMGLHNFFTLFSLQLYAVWRGCFHEYSSRWICDNSPLLITSRHFVFYYEWLD